MLTIQDLNKIKDENFPIVSLRKEGKTQPKDAKYKRQILICGGTGCTSSGCHKVVDALDKALKKYKLTKDIKVVKTGCFGLCALGPIMIVYPEGSFYSNVLPEQMDEIVNEHIKSGNVVKKYLYSETIHEDGSTISLNETKFYKKQLRVALRNCGVIDPEDVKEYIALDGYQALAKVLTKMTPQETIQVIKDSKLRGRGGGGFPTGLKWEFAAKEKSDQKYVCCNADEGDPGAFMDRSILEGDPHCVIEAMAIAGYAIGANKGYIYIRAEYPIAVKRLMIAIQQAKDFGILGKGIFNTKFDFDIDIRLGAGAFVCGEETALITSIEGHRGEPRPRPPFPAVKGLFGKPTILNNVETYANIAQIFLNGTEWFTNIGTEKSKGTKVFALGGKITNVGLVEVPMGTTLREIVEEIGGGVPDGKKFKAAQTGGPSGGCIPACHMDTPIDYDNLLALGSMMGSGGLIVMDEDNCMVDIAKFFLEFTVDESCGKCTSCRIGTRRLYQFLEKISQGKAEYDDIAKIEELAHHMQTTSLCALGQTAANPVISTLKYFKDEYLAHVVDKRCPSQICKDLLQYSILPDKCIGCTLCARNCPVDAIVGEVKSKHYIDTKKCIKCGLCLQNCKFKAIVTK